MEKETKLIIDKQPTLNIDDLITYCNELETQLKKQKEIIDKTIEYIKSNPLVAIEDYDIHVNDLIEQENYLKV